MQVRMMPRTTTPRLFDARRRDSNCGVLIAILTASDKGPSRSLPVTWRVKDSADDS